MTTPTVPFFVLLAAADALDAAYERSDGIDPAEWQKLLTAKIEMRVYVNIILSGLPEVKVIGATL